MSNTVNACICNLSSALFNLEKSNIYYQYYAMENCMWKKVNSNLVIKLGFDTVNMEWTVGENVICRNTSLNSATVRVLLGENYGESDALMYTIFYPICERGEITVIAHGGSWSILGKASLPCEKWASWVENLIQNDITKVIEDEDSYSSKRVVPDMPEDFEDSNIEVRQYIKGSFKPKSLIIVGLTSPKAAEKLFNQIGADSDAGKITGWYGMNLYKNAAIPLKLLEADKIFS